MYDVQHRYDDEGDCGGDGGSVMSMDEVRCSLELIMDHNYWLHVSNENTNLLYS